MLTLTRKRPSAIQFREHNDRGNHCLRKSLHTPVSTRESLNFGFLTRQDTNLRVLLLWLVRGLKLWLKNPDEQHYQCENHQRRWFCKYSFWLSKIYWFRQVIPWPGQNRFILLIIRQIPIQARSINEQCTRGIRVLLDY